MGGVEEVESVMETGWPSPGEAVAEFGEKRGEGIRGGGERVRRKGDEGGFELIEEAWGEGREVDVVAEGIAEGGGGEAEVRGVEGGGGEVGVDADAEEEEERGIFGFRFAMAVGKGSWHPG